MPSLKRFLLELGNTDKQDYRVEIRAAQLLYDVMEGQEAPRLKGISTFCLLFVHLRLSRSGGPNLISIAE